MPIEPLPSTGISKILGLCQSLDESGGRDNLYRITQELHLPFGELLLVVKGAEMLELVETPGNEVVLTPTGKRVLAAPLAEKKKILREQMLKLEVFRHLHNLVENSDGRALPANLLLEQLAMLLPHEPPRQVFTTLLNWGRYGDIFDYDRESDVFSLVAGA